MHTLEIPQINVKIDIPSQISELSNSQYITFIELYLLLNSGTIEYEHFRVSLLDSFVGFKKPIAKLNKAQLDTVYSEIYRLSELMDTFCVMDSSGKHQVNFNNVVNLIPSIPIAGVNLLGPSDALADITFYEYIDAHNLYIDFINSQQEETLDRLIATLYRPQIPGFEKKSISNAYDGQRRIKYNQHIVHARADLIHDLPFQLKYGIFLFFHGCETFLREGEITLGGATISFSLLYKTSGVASFDDTGLVGVLFTLAESQVFGNSEQTAATNLYDVMVRLYQLMKIYDQQEHLSKNDPNKTI